MVGKVTNAPWEGNRLYELPGNSGRSMMSILFKRFYVLRVGYFRFIDTWRSFIEIRYVLTEMPQLLPATGMVLNNVRILVKQYLVLKVVSNNNQRLAIMLMTET